jgi:hypothetical protein
MIPSPDSPAAMMRRIGIVLFACALSFGGEALARLRGNQSSPIY